jgi:hypothetical protein
MSETCGVDPVTTKVKVVLKQQVSSKATHSSSSAMIHVNYKINDEQLITAQNSSTIETNKTRPVTKKLELLQRNKIRAVTEKSLKV